MYVKSDITEKHIPFHLCIQSSSNFYYKKITHTQYTYQQLFPEMICTSQCLSVITKVLTALLNYGT